MYRGGETLVVWCDECMAATERAILVRTDGWDEDVWVPRSQIAGDDAESIMRGDREFELEVSAWFARKYQLC